MTDVNLAGARMYESTQDAAWVHGIDLTQESDFDLGSMRVRPATCEVEWHSVSQTLQRRVMQVLVVLAHARGAVVSQDDLILRCWRGLSVSDDAIYRCISKLRKLAADYSEAPYTIEAIPGVGYRLIPLDTAGAPAAIGSRQLHPSRMHFHVWFSAAALLMVAAAATFWMLGEWAPQHRPLRVAVQPFEALSDTSGARSLWRRIPNEIVDVLGDSQIETVLIGEQAGRSTTGAVPGLIVTGIIRDDGHSTVVDVRLEDGGTRAALWSTKFERDSRETADLPLEVAARIADVVNMVDFARHAKPPLDDDSALTALLQANDMLRGASDDTWAPMIQKAQNVVARHPDFAFGHDVLAASYAAALESADVPDRAAAMRAAAQREANLTLKLDPQDAGVYVVLSGLVPAYDYAQREEILQRGIRFARHPKQPLAGLYSYEGIFLSDVGHLREALSFQLVAHAKDEWGPARTTKLAFTYANMGNVIAARNALQKAVQFWPNHEGVWRWQQYIAGFYEEPSEALSTFKSLDARGSLRESNAIWRVFVEAKAAQSVKAANGASVRILAAGDEGTITRENEIMMLAGLGLTKQAFEVANAVLDHQQLDSWFLFTPVTRDLRQDAGFVPLAARMGLIKYWRQSGKRPDFCTGAAMRTECSAQLVAALR